MSEYNHDPEAGGIKHDQDKVQVELLPVEALMEVGKVLTLGAKKYAPDNWRKGMSWRRVYGAALRHLFAWAGGQDKDPESGLSHLAHACCCVMFLVTYEALGLGTDDRASRSDPPSEGKPEAAALVQVANVAPEGTWESQQDYEEAGFEDMTEALLGTGYRVRSVELVEAGGIYRYDVQPPSMPRDIAPLLDGRVVYTWSAA